MTYWFERNKNASADSGVPNYWPFSSFEYNNRLRPSPISLLLECTDPKKKRVTSKRLGGIIYFRCNHLLPLDPTNDMDNLGLLMTSLVHEVSDVKVNQRVSILTKTDALGDRFASKDHKWNGQSSIMRHRVVKLRGKKIIVTFERWHAVLCPQTVGGIRGRPWWVDTPSQ